MKKNAIIRIIIFSIIIVLLIGLLGAGILFQWIPIRSYEQHTSNDAQSISRNHTNNNTPTSDNSPTSNTAPTSDNSHTGSNNHTNDKNHTNNAAGDLDHYVGDIDDIDDYVEDNLIGGTVASVGSVPYTQVSELEIQWVAGSITIVPGDTDQIEFSETANTEKPMIWKQVGNKLVIQFCEGWRTMNFGFKVDDLTKDLVVTVPRDWYPRQVQVDAVSAEVNMSDLNVMEIEVDSVSGVCNLQNCVVDDLSLDSVSGNIDFTGSIGEMDCNTVSGSCNIITDRIPREIDLECMSGKMDLTLPADAGFIIEMENPGAELTSDFALTKRGRSYIAGDGRCQIGFEGISGELFIRMPAQ